MNVEMLVADRVCVGCEHTVGAALVDEREPVERVGRAEPDEAGGGGVERRTQLLGEGLAEE